MTSQPLQSCFFKFVDAISFEVRALTSFSLLVERVFLFISVINILVTFDFTHKNDFLTLKLTFIYFNSKR